VNCVKPAGTSTVSEIVAAGAVLWRTASESVEVAVVHRPRYDDWSLPKGKLARGESVPAAAVRELAEETGATAVLGVQLGDSRYRVPQGDKVVHYWSARASGGEFAPNDEVDELRWLPPEQAGGLLSYPRDGEILDRFRQLEPRPRPLLLVRHAKAGSRYDWDGDDYQRPLTVKGREQAGELSKLLHLFGPTRAYAATPIRCAQTIQPLANRLHLPITPEPLLGEEDYWKDPDAAFARFLALSAGSEVAVVCSQGGVIPDLITRLTGKEEPPARKASTWVLGFAGDRVVTADYYSEPTG